MNIQNEEYHRMIEEHLSMLTNHGRDYVEKAISSILLLEKDIFGEMELSDKERKELFQVLISAVNKHKELISRCIRERKDYSDQFRDNQA